MYLLERGWGELTNDIDLTYVPYMKPRYRFLKRVVDLVLCIPGLLIFGIFYCVLAIFYQFGSNKGPILYKQARIGRLGETFYIYKFRSMVVDADKKLRENEELYAKYVANSYKLEVDEDPRITKLGKFIRKTSIDEIPQILNVLRGEMSFVGPRPIIESELAEYNKIGGVLPFTLMTPGITGLWQANGRSDILYPERCQVELQYLENDSIWNDLKIIFRTVINVFKQEGVY